MKKTMLKLALICLALIGMSNVVGAQTITTLGATPPTPGVNDISQLTGPGTIKLPDGLNYYTDNGPNHGAGAGQTFTTGANGGGYVLTSVTLKTGATDSGGGGAGPETGGYILDIYSISGTGNTNATLVASYTVGQNTFIYTVGDWIQVSGLGVTLSPNAIYAYSFQRTTAGWDDLDVDSGNPYAGGEIALIPNAGGSVIYSTSHSYDAEFDIGLTLPTSPIVGTPTATPNPAYALSTVVVSDTEASGTTLKWQTNTDLSGGLGGTWVTVSGATGTSLTNIPATSGSAYALDYQFIASNTFGSVTSAPVELIVNPATAPQISTDTTPTGPIAVYVGATLSLSATFVGTTPITNQWQTDAGQTGTYTNIPGATTGTLTVTNLQTINAGNYRLLASNALGSTPSTPVVVTVLPVIYSENFNLPTSPDQPVTHVGWVDDLNNTFTPAGGGSSDTRDFASTATGVTYPNMAVYSYDPVAATEAFYATTATANGGPYFGGTISNHMALPIINLATVQNLSFTVDLNSGFAAEVTHSFIAVQLNFGQWYVSTTELTEPADNLVFITDSLPFSSTASAWNLLTVSGTGSIYNTNFPVIGAVNGTTLSGYITGVGIVCVHSANSTIQFDNYTVLGTIPPTALPVISSPPFSVTNYAGTTAMFSVTATTNGSAIGLTYQWQTNTAVGSGTWANLSNAGQFSGVTSPALAVANVSTAANHKDYRVIVTDGAGSSTSAPPATLTVIDSAPLLTAGTTIYPDASLGFASANASYRVGNNNTLHLTASFIGDLPMSFQWSVSPNPDGSSAVNVAGATSSTLTLSNPQTNSTGYYTVTVSNSQSVTPTNSGLAQLTVLPADPTLIQWSAPVTMNGLTAAQILFGVPGTYIGAESFSATAPISVTNGGTIFLFDNTGVAASTAGDFRSEVNAYTGPSTGDTNLDTVLGIDSDNSGGSTVVLNNLTIGQLYSAQLVSMNDTAGNTRQASWSDPLDVSNADFSAAFTMGENAYVVGTFVANNTTETITENEVSGGYLAFVIVRNGLPTLSESKSGSNLQLTWNFGTLLEATSLKGPWTSDGTSGSFLVTPTGPQKFYRVSFP